MTATGWLAGNGKTPPFSDGRGTVGTAPRPTAREIVAVDGGGGINKDARRAREAR